MKIKSIVAADERNKTVTFRTDEEITPELFEQFEQVAGTGTEILKCSLRESLLVVAVDAMTPAVPEAVNEALAEAQARLAAAKMEAQASVERASKLLGVPLEEKATDPLMQIPRQP